jgi:hypothetical protein
MRTDGHEEANSRFSKFCESTEKALTAIRSSANIRTSFLPNRRIDCSIHVDVRNGSFLFGVTAPSGSECPHSRGF